MSCWCHASLPVVASSASRELAKRLLPRRLPPKKSGLAEPVGTRTYPCSSSTDITPQELAAPVVAAWEGFHSAAAGCVGLSGIGSNDHRCAPVLASKARITPRSTSVARLSPTDDPTTIVSPRTAGGDVTS